MKLTKELYDRIMATAPAQFGHHLEHGFMHPRITPVEPHMKMLGPAYTVRMTERDGSALYYAIMKAEKGSVIVVDRGSEDIFAPAGDQLVLMMKHRELGGLVVDGYGQTKLGFSATTKIDRTAFGVTWNAALEAGGFTLGNDVTVTLEIQFVLPA